MFNQKSYILSIILYIICVHCLIILGWFFFFFIRSISVFYWIRWINVCGHQRLKIMYMNTSYICLMCTEFSILLIILNIKREQIGQQKERERKRKETIQLSQMQRTINDVLNIMLFLCHCLSFFPIKITQCCQSESATTTKTATKKKK